MPACSASTRATGLTLLFPQWAARNPIATGGAGGRYLAHFAHAPSLQLGQVKAGDPLALPTRADAGATGSRVAGGRA